MKFLKFIKSHIVTTVLLCAIAIATVFGVIMVSANTVSISSSINAISFNETSGSTAYVSCGSTVSIDSGNPSTVWSWISDNPGVASVSDSNSADNTVMAQAAGKTNINVSCKLSDDSASQSLIIPVTVNVIINHANVDVIKTTLDGSDSVTVNGCAENPITWTSSNENVVSVAKDTETTATISYVSGGSATITARTADGLSASFPVRVGVSITSDHNVQVRQGEQVAVTTNSADAASVYWWSDNADVATATAGMITGVYAGTTNVYASSDPNTIENNAGDYVTVTVPFEAREVSGIATIGDQIEWSTTAKPDEVAYTSDDQTIVTFNRTTGKFEALKTGTTTIHAVWGSNQLDKEITVVDGFSISRSQVSMNIGDSVDLTTMSTNTQADIIWSISDDTIASFVTNGASSNTGDAVTVTGLRTGSTTLVASQTINGVVKTCTCEIYILNPVTSLTLLYNGQEIHDTISIQKGNSLYITAYLNINDGNAPDNTVLSWVSSDDSILTVEPTTTEGQQQLCKVSAHKGGTATVTVVSDDGLYISTANFYISEGVAGISLDKTDVSAQMALEKYQLTATVVPDSAGVDKSVIWSSLDESVVKVDQNGLVTFVGPGTTYVLATSVADPNFQASCKFLISQQVDDVEMDFKTVTLNVGDEFRLSALITPEDATNQTIYWSSSNEDVVEVDDTGLLEAISSGSATIIVQTEDGGYIDTCNVTVLQPVESITLSETEVSVRKGTTFYLNATCNPNTADDKSVTWASSDTSLATVDQSGKVITLAVGSVTISCMSDESGVVAYCLVDITEPVTGLELNSYYEELVKDTKFVLIPTVMPLDAPDKEVSYISSEPDVATVDENGIVTAIKGGVAEIVVTTHESNISKTCRIVVEEFVESVEITGAEEILYVNEYMQLGKIVETESASNKNVIWSSSNKKLATVDATGRVTGVKPGKVVITAVAADGSGASDSVVIKVINPAKKVSLSDSKITIYVGETHTLKPTITPSDATIQELEWTSDNSEIAQIYENGDVVGMAPGRTFVRIRTTDGSDLTASCMVVVKERIMATSLTINSHEVSMLKGKTRKLQVRLFPRNCMETVNWMSTDTSIVQVDPDGNIVTVGPGTAEVIAYTNYGTLQDSCTIHSLAMHYTSIAMEQYDTFNLYVDGAVTPISWRTSNPRIATVDENGLVTGRMPGECTISATTDNKTVSCFVKIHRNDPGKFINMVDE